MSKIKLFFICILIGLTVGGLFAILFNQKHHVDDKQTVYIGIHTQKETEKKEKRNFKQALGFNPHLVSTSLSWESFFPKSWVEKQSKTKVSPLFVGIHSIKTIPNHSLLKAFQKEFGTTIY